jgi:hypothetical protein
VIVYIQRVRGSPRTADNGFGFDHIGLLFLILFFSDGTAKARYYVNSPNPSLKAGLMLKIILTPHFSAGVTESRNLLGFSPALKNYIF